MPLLGNLHVIPFCQVFETISLELSRDSIFLQDHAKFRRGIDLLWSSGHTHWKCCIQIQLR